MVKKITPIELKKALEEKAPIQLIDVREAYEREICHIGGIHLPINRFIVERNKLDLNKQKVFYCRSGIRSENAIYFLSHYGFENMYNLEGGLLRWIKEVDPSLRSY